MRKNKKERLVDILVKISDGKPVPEKIQTPDGQIWTYEPDFGQYKNDQFQELIKYLHGDYNEEHRGIVYPLIFKVKVKPLGGYHD